MIEAAAAALLAFAQGVAIAIGFALVALVAAFLVFVLIALFAGLFS